jgi:hypothetical protein
MSKKLTFKSQLFVFADKFDDRFETLFEGKVIIEYDFQSIVRAPINDDIYMLHSILEATGHHQKSARIVINFDKDLKKDVRAYQTIALSYGNFIGFLLQRKKDQDKLDKFHTVFARLENIEEYRNSLSHFDITQFVKSLSPATKMDIFSKNTQMVDSIDEWINTVRVESYRKFLSSFSV